MRRKNARNTSWAETILTGVSVSQNIIPLVRRIQPLHSHIIGGGSGLAVEEPPSRRQGRPGDVFDNIITKAQSNSAQNQGSPREEAQKGKLTVTLYKNGYTVNKGELRDTELPENQLFLQQLDRGEVPPEFAVHGKVIDVHLEDERLNDYIPPAYTAFSGGSSLRSTSSSSSSGAYIFTPEMVADIQAPVVDEAQAVTTLMIRTHAGKKIKLKVNHSTSMMELAAMIYELTGPSASFVLSAGFPPADIKDSLQSVKEAGLVGAAVTQKSV
jgi:UBX domain-containing protein 1